ncbi:MAG: glycosyltransferase family 4 protein [Candidatus Altiarchaeota archaeon]|nr:glycosyltransferase family 4 protein [Candidatus Altiarchaeota archaeon]
MISKILFVTPWFGGFAGGAEALARNTAKEMKKRCFEVVVFSTCCRSPYESWWEDHLEKGHQVVEGLDVYRFPVNKNRERYEAAVHKSVSGMELTQEEKDDFFRCGIGSDELVEAVGKYINDGFEVIALPYFQGLTHAIVNRYPGKITLMPCFHDEPQFYWENTKNLMVNAKNVLFLSQEEKELAIRNYGLVAGRKIVEYPPVGAGIELDAVVGAPQHVIEGDYFIYSGRKERGKNVHLLCEWFGEFLKETGKNCKLVFIGGGDESLIPKDDHFIDLGFVGGGEKYSLISKSAGLVNLSVNESFSFVIFEAWLCRVPVVVHGDCAVTKGHVLRANGGLYAQDKDVFIHVLKYMLENPGTAKELNLNGMNYARENFNFDSVLERILFVLGGGDEVFS